MSKGQAKHRGALPLHPWRKLRDVEWAEHCEKTTIKVSFDSGEDELYRYVPQNMRRPTRPPVEWSQILKTEKEEADKKAAELATQDQKKVA